MGLLALVLLRSLVPTGFMPAWVDGHFALVLCEGQGALPAARSAAHHHHRVDGAAPVSRQHAGTDCAYAQSADPALPMALEIPHAPLVPLTDAAPARDVRGPFASLPRYRAARGPPVPA